MKIEEVKTVSIPHMEVVDKLWKLPMIEYAWTTSYDIYGRVKASHDILNWTFSTAEGAMHKAIEHVAPVAMKFEQPIHTVDEKLCQGLDKLEEKLPLVKQPPSQVYENAKNYVSSSIQPAVQTVQESFIFKEVKKFNVKSLKELTWSKANDIISSPYGHVALSGVDFTTLTADRYLDYYMPADKDDETEIQHVHSVHECDDKVMHAVHTVGVLSNKVSRRLYYTVSHRIGQINKQNINEYLSSLALVVQLTNFLNSVNRSVEETTSPKDENQ
ncbi:lipid storage droplets surface-binding protein 2-like [Lycorma delicatula]|uniref:lipid storage droplets surface-binding protein 2-like n=1 Tax=Lycorma delicatula TaxID=130591 RepID=UPI003F516735